MRGSDYIFNHVNSLEYHFHKVSLNRRNSYIPTPDWLSHKKTTINPYNYADNTCFLYAIIIALNSQNIDHHPERISKLTPFIDNYNWDNICFPAGHKDYSVLEKNNSEIAINILYILDKTQEIRQCYTSKHNKTRNIHTNLLMITDGCGNWHYLAIKSIPRLLRGITSTHDGDFYCLNCFHSYRTSNKLKKHVQLCQVNHFCNLVLPNEENKYISSTLGKNDLTIQFIIYADIECLLVKMDSCENSDTNSYIENKSLHAPSGYSLITCYSFDKSLYEQKYYRGEDCMQKFSQDLKEIFIKLINYEQKSMIPLTDQEKEAYDKEKVCFLCKGKYCYDKTNKKEYKLMCKVRDHCHFTGKYRGAAHSKCNLKHKVPKFIPLAFDNGPNHDNHFIIKQLAKYFNGYFSCIGENTEKYISFSITMLKKSDNLNKKKKIDAFSLRFIDTYRFMNRSLSELVGNLSEPGKNIPNDV